ncbi:DUF4190 domain-containing protein [Streptomyces sp. NBC_01314]|uniref:DUF4190 domain-containing protein n=1 Tax=Streptomyces sp. NBC_01314 TaxID=2903821 RepID=UPI003090A112|nr:DUF4190 domain-containing protein [Streptomyces sp. NBC_01314]
MPSDEAPIPETPAAPRPDPWTPPQDRVPAPARTVADGAALPRVADAVPASAGSNAASQPEGVMPAPKVALNKPTAPTGSAPSPPSVHDQMTVASMPGVDATGPIPAGVGGPVSPQAPATPQSWAGPGTFAPPGGPQSTMSSTSAPDPFAPPAPYTSYPPPVAGVPHVAPTPGAAVPPPPISPDGPGQVPYGYPQYPAYQGVPAHPGVGYPAPGVGYPAPGAGYAWPVMAPPPSNGMGIAAMVLGICAAVLFCLWPLAILLGVMAVVFGCVGRAKVRRGEATNPGHALAGIICGVVGILLGIGFIVLIIVAPGSDGYDSDPSDDGYSTSLSLMLPPGDSGV